jgi:sugar/nucleoside kinase (ribokinase family)
MNDSCEIQFLKDDFVTYGIVAPNHIEVMKKHLKLFKESGVKTFFDPGQQITQMTKEELEYCFKYTDYIILNEYEYEVIKKQAEKTDEEMIT